MDARVLSYTLARQLGGEWHSRPLGQSAFCGTWLAEQGKARLFVKTAAATRGALLQAEADGLAAIAAMQAIRVPQVAWLGSDQEAGALLALEWLDLHPPDAGFGARLGKALAALHREPCPLSPPRYGWRQDNCIGATPQVNAMSKDDSAASWAAFFRSQRLDAMRARLAPDQPELRDAISAVAESLPRFFDDGHTPSPRLIHGDLWQGNWGMLADGTPVIYDPAVSCSDAEAELAMMELFGAPPAGFWPAYRAAAGLHPGYPARRALYQLYHLLNHAVLFGAGYAAQALRCANALARA